MNDVTAVPDEPKKKRKTTALDIVIYVLCAALVVCIVMAARSFAEYKKGASVYENIAADIARFNFGPPDTAGDTGAGNAAEHITDNATAGDETAVAATPEQETAVQTDAAVLDFEALRRINPDVVAWIYSPGTPVSYPVVRTDSEDDYEYYLDHLVDGTKNKLGTLFIDARNYGYFGDCNTIIYGHNMLNGTMFSSLLGYRKQSYYDVHPRLYIYTADGAYSLELFSAYTIAANPSHYIVDFNADGAPDMPEDMAAGGAGEQSYADFIETVASYSDFKTSVLPTTSDRIVTLSTCDIRNDSNRYIVFGVLKPLK